MRVASRADPELVKDFLSDRDAGKPPYRREKAHPELRDGMSTFGSLAAARARWREMHATAQSRGEEVRAGYFIAEVELQPDRGFSLEDLGEPDEHVTIWGDPAALVASVRHTYPALTDDD